MAVVLNATWIIRPGEEDVVMDALRHLAPASRREPGNLHYQAYRDPAEPSVIRIFEVYADDAAVAGHTASEHFQTWAVGRAIPALAERRRDFFETIDA